MRQHLVLFGCFEISYTCKCNTPVICCAQLNTWNANAFYTPEKRLFGYRIKWLQLFWNCHANINRERERASNKTLGMQISWATLSSQRPVTIDDGPHERGASGRPPRLRGRWMAWESVGCGASGCCGEERAVGGEGKSVACGDVFLFFWW